VVVEEGKALVEEGIAEVLDDGTLEVDELDDEGGTTDDDELGGGTTLELLEGGMDELLEGVVDDDTDDDDDDVRLVDDEVTGSLVEFEAMA